MSYDVRSMRPDEADAVVAFLRAHGAPGLVRRLPDYFTWFYLDHPLGTDVRVCLDRESGAIVGVSGFVRTRLAVGGREGTGAFSTNTVVAPEHRRRGLAAELHAQRARDYDVALSSGQSPANRAVYAKLGFVALGRYRRARVAPRGPVDGGIGRRLRDTASWLRWRRASRGHAGGPYEVRRTPVLPAIPDAWWRGRWPDDVVAPIWTPDEIAWRYASHPYLAYEFCLVDAGSEALGLAVVRRAGATTVVVDLYGRWSDLPRVLHGLTATATGPLTAVYVGGPLDALFTGAGWSAADEAMSLLGRSDRDDVRDRLGDRPWCVYAGSSDKDR